MNTIFILLEVFLRLFDSWDAFLAYAERRRIEELASRSAERDAALVRIKVATTEEEFDAAQADIVRNRPK